MPTTWSRTRNGVAATNSTRGARVSTETAYGMSVTTDQDEAGADRQAQQRRRDDVAHRQGPRARPGQATPQGVRHGEQAHRAQAGADAFGEEQTNQAAIPAQHSL